MSSADKHPSGNHAFLNGLMANLLNTKAAIFFISILPQLVTDQAHFIQQVVVLGIIDIAIGFLWWGVFIAMIDKLYSLSQNNQVRRKIEIFTGSALLIIGVIFAVKSLYSLVLLN